MRKKHIKQLCAPKQKPQESQSFCMGVFSCFICFFSWKQRMMYLISFFFSMWKKNMWSWKKLRHFCVSQCIFCGIWVVNHHYSHVITLSWPRYPSKKSVFTNYRFFPLSFLIMNMKKKNETRFFFTWAQSLNI